MSTHGRSSTGGNRGSGGSEGGRSRRISSSSSSTPRPPINRRTESSGAFSHDEITDENILERQGSSTGRAFMGVARGVARTISGRPSAAAGAALSDSSGGRGAAPSSSGSTDSGSTTGSGRSKTSTIHSEFVVTRSFENLETLDLFASNRMSSQGRFAELAPKSGRRAGRRKSNLYDMQQQRQKQLEALQQEQQQQQIQHQQQQYQQDDFSGSGSERKSFNPFTIAATAIVSSISSASTKASTSVRECWSATTTTVSTKSNDCAAKSSAFCCCCRCPTRQGCLTFFKRLCTLSMKAWFLKLFFVAAFLIIVKTLQMTEPMEIVVVTKLTSPGRLGQQASSSTNSTTEPEAIEYYRAVLVDALSQKPIYSRILANEIRFQLDESIVERRRQLRSLQQEQQSSLTNSNTDTNIQEEEEQQQQSSLTNSNADKNGTQQKEEYVTNNNTETNGTNSNATDANEITRTSTTLLNSTSISANATMTTEQERSMGSKPPSTRANLTITQSRRQGGGTFIRSYEHVGTVDKKEVLLAFDGMVYDRTPALVQWLYQKTTYTRTVDLRQIDRQDTSTEIVINNVRFQMHPDSEFEVVCRQDQQQQQNQLPAQVQEQEELGIISKTTETATTDAKLEEEQECHVFLVTETPVGTEE